MGDKLVGGVSNLPDLSSQLQVCLQFACIHAILHGHKNQIYIVRKFSFYTLLSLLTLSLDGVY